MTKVPQSELTDRMRRFRARMDGDQPHWELAAFFGRVNQFYFTGTMQDGVLLVPRDGDALLFVRRSFERALEESEFPNIRPMKSFRDAAPLMGAAATGQTLHVETELVPLAHLNRFRKHFRFDEVAPLDASIARVRSIKSPFEIEVMERAGEIHRRVLEELLPGFLREGMSEADLGCELYSLMVREGHQGTVRFGMFGVDIAVAQLGFGENSLYPTSFDGPGGCRGISPAAPVLGSRERKLRKGDLVFVDVGFALDGYHTDKTMVYSFGQLPSGDLERLQKKCVSIEHDLASALKIGAIPSEIHAEIMNSLEPEFLKNFMGFGNRKANFLGHGLGLQIDEPPVLTEGFDDPLEENMVLALEPKVGVAGFGMVGSENTYVVGPTGGRSLTGSHPGLMAI